MAAQILMKNGFTKVYNVLPGMTEWNGNVIKEILMEEFNYVKQSSNYRSKWWNVRCL